MSDEVDISMGKEVTVEEGGSMVHAEQEGTNRLQIEFDTEMVVRIIYIPREVDPP